MPENCSIVIDQLVQQRREQGMTQRDLAAAASLKQSVIARLESKRAMPQLDTLIKVANALGCRLEVIPNEE